MTKKNKIMLITLGCVGFLIGFLIFTFYSNFYDKEVMSDTEEQKTTSNKMMSLMLETSRGSGEYKSSKDNKWPSYGYVFNSELSKCENGGILTWNEDKGTVTVKTNTTDKCYVYFDIKPADLTIATNNIPTTFGKLGNISCSNSVVSYNQKYNRVEISDINAKYENCTLNYTDSTSKVNLATYITGLSGTTQGTGQVVNENGYRYEGKNPNNYIWFNNEYWRIIGVFDSASHGVSGQNLVKIIRDIPLEALMWNTQNETNWDTASLKLLLNSSYYNAQDGTNSDYCYFKTDGKMNCNYSKKGIQDSYRGMVANVTWYLGGYTYGKDESSSSYYNYERGSSVYQSNSLTSTAYIGLIYVSDYGYAVLSSSCARHIPVSSYDTTTCAGQNWLYNGGMGLFINTQADGKYVFYTSTMGSVDSSGYNINYITRPVLYLKDSVYKISGDGSISNPYIIGN